MGRSTAFWRTIEGVSLVRGCNWCPKYKGVKANEKNIDSVAGGITSAFGRM